MLLELQLPLVCLYTVSYPEALALARQFFMPNMVIVTLNKGGMVCPLSPFFEFRVSIGIDQPKYSANVTNTTKQKKLPDERYGTWLATSGTQKQDEAGNAFHKMKNSLLQFERWVTKHSREFRIIRNFSRTPYRWERSKPAMISSARPSSLHPAQGCKGLKHQIETKQGTNSHVHPARQCALCVEFHPWEHR